MRRIDEDREKNPKELETHDWGVEVRLVIVDTGDLGETSRYEANLVRNECAVLECGRPTAG